VRQLQEKALTDDKCQLGVAFVTFVNRETAQMAAQCVIRHDDLFHPVAKRWVCDPAPCPETVNWEKLHVSHLQRWIVSALVNVATFFLIFFWMIPVSFAASISNLTTLQQVEMLKHFEVLLILLFISSFFSGLSFSRSSRQCFASCN
jgi:hypothetical protein